jgi:hypothetical protein
MNENYQTNGASYEAACAALNLDPQNELPFKAENLTPRQKCSNAHTKLLIINEAMHIGFEGEKEYEPYFYKDPSGPGWSYYGYDDRGTRTLVGPRLKYGTRAMSRFAATTHIELYNEMFQ